MHDLRRSTLDRLEDHVVFLRFVELHDSKHATSHLVFKRLLAQLAFKRLPKVGCNFGPLVDQSLAIEPLFQAFYVDLTHATTALAWADELIAWFVL